MHRSAFPLRCHLWLWSLCLIVLVSCSSSPATTAVHATATTTVMATPAPSVTAETPVPSATPAPDLDQRIDAYINRLTPAQQIGQLLMLAVYADSYSADLNTALQQWHIGNAIVFPNYNGGPLKPTTLAGMQQLIHDLQSHADSPLLVATDEEGGLVDRLSFYYGASPSPADLVATGDPQKAYAQAQLDAQRMLNLGVNLDFAPLADVYQGGSIDESRMFGTTVDQVTRFAGAFLDGLQQHSVAGTLKHWPGIGAVNANPDFALPTLMHSQAQLNATDFATFRALLTHHPSMIMATHVIVLAYDATYPASLSPTLIDGVLRGQLGYHGIVVTDAMDAQGIIQFMQQQGYSDPGAGIAEASVLALLAGNDIVECPIEPDRLAATVTAVTNAVHSGRITPDRLHQAVHRVIKLKAQMGLIKLP